MPLVLALGLGVSNAIGATEGFGILSCASFCPILSVLVCGLIVDHGRPMGVPKGYQIASPKETEE